MLARKTPLRRKTPMRSLKTGGGARRAKSEGFKRPSYDEMKKIWDKAAEKRRLTAKTENPARLRKQLQAGKRMKKRQAIVRELKPQFQKAGITFCELHFAKCMRDNYLGFAHSKKSRHINTEEDWREVILCCRNCHDIIEAKSEAEMGAIVRGVINMRTYL